MTPKTIAWLLKLLNLFVVISAILHFIGAFNFVRKTNLGSLDLIITLLQISFEAIFFAQIYILIVSIINSLLNKGKLQYVTSLDEYPFIEVVIPIRSVNSLDLEKTLSGIRSANYQQDKIAIHLGDDTTNPELVKQYKELCVRFNATHHHRIENKKYKAGMLNLILQELQTRYVVFFDYDQIPHKNIFCTFVSLLENNPEISYIQAKKEFRDLNTLAKVWSAGLYLLFFEIFERNKTLNDTVFFSGSTACFRRDELLQIGGFPTYSFTEDNSLTLAYLTLGKKTMYFDNIGSIGLVPPTYRLQISQLWRWSNGASTVLTNQFMKVVKTPSLRRSQKIDIIGTLAISPVVVALYVYCLSFVILISRGVDAQRFSYSGISSLILTPVMISLVYILLITNSIYLSRKSEYSEYRYRDIPGFLIIALASNLLTITSGLSGLFGLFSPNSKHGKWTREIRLIPMSIIFFFVGSFLIIKSIMWFIIGFESAIVVVLIGFTFLPSLLIVLYYDLKESNIVP
ncbi:MAG: glycosyltransferase [Candidatus Heimdallarchaeota archaeon]|nr:glycosyltransferase [Candidatus Heimdallarchaeota archaeon]